MPPEATNEGDPLALRPVRPEPDARGRRNAQGRFASHAGAIFLNWASDSQKRLGITGVSYRKLGIARQPYANIW
jgi:hypothetical protein